MDIKKLETATSRVLYAEYKPTPRRQNQLPEGMIGLLTPYLNKGFKELKILITSLLKQKEINGLIIRGEAGIGKTYSVIDVLEKHKKSFNILNSYTTPLEFYHFLYKNKDNKVIVLDDVAGFFDNPINKGLVLSALWETKNNKRVVSYHSTTDKLKIPKTFNFKSKIIWCVNHLPKELSAIKSRCYYDELSFGYEEKINLFYEMATIKKIPFKIVNFIKENSDEETKEFNFRLVIKAWAVYKTDKEDWESIVLKWLGDSERMILLKQLLKDNPKTAEKKFIKKTKLHKATFYRLKKKVAKSHTF